MSRRRLDIGALRRKIVSVNIEEICQLALIRLSCGVIKHLSAIIYAFLSHVRFCGSLGLMNTPQKGKFRHIVFKDGDTWYAVALEFNIVETGDEPRLAFLSLLQAVDGYIKSISKIKGARYSALNQATDSEYEKLWRNLHSPRSVKSPFQIAMYGVSAV